MQLCSSLNILWHCLSLGLEWKLPFPVLWPLLSFPNLLYSQKKQDWKLTVAQIMNSLLQNSLKLKKVEKTTRPFRYDLNQTPYDYTVEVTEFQLSYFKSWKMMLWKCRTQYASIWKTQQWPQDWKRSVFVPIPKKGNAKECSNYCTIALISHTSKVMLKILQVRLQQYVNWKLPDVQAGFRKGKRTRYQVANIHWTI